MAIGLWLYIGLWLSPQIYAPVTYLPTYLPTDNCWLDIHMQILI